MADDDYTEDEETLETTSQTTDGPDIRQLRKQAKEAEGLRKQLAEYQQRDNLQQAGLNELSERQIKAVFATHEGESTPDLLRRTAEELGFVQPQGEVAPEVKAGHEQIQAASRGAQAVDQGSYDDEVKTARNREELHAIMRKYGKPIVE